MENFSLLESDPMETIYHLEDTTRLDLTTNLWQLLLPLMANLFQ
jgi:hypothetical protein